jgi:hypothetical protein
MGEGQRLEVTTVGSSEKCLGSRGDRQRGTKLKHGRVENPRQCHSRYPDQRGRREKRQLVDDGPCEGGATL